MKFDYYVLRVTSLCVITLPIEIALQLEKIKDGWRVKQIDYFDMDYSKDPYALILLERDI